MKSGINPFDSQEAKPYKNDPEILAMTNLVRWVLCYARFKCLFVFWIHKTQGNVMRVVMSERWKKVYFEIITCNIVRLADFVYNWA